MKYQPLTEQAIFTKVANHLMTQGKKSKGGTSCRYRSPDGLTCAVGCLIPKKAYTSDIEGAAINTLTDLYPAVARAAHIYGLDAEALGTLRRLQIIHDDEPVTSWAAKLRYLARDRMLDISKVPKLAKGAK